MLPIEYVAGFIDGEGGFGIYPKSVRMTVSNANRSVLVMVAEVVGGGRISARPPAKATHGVGYELQVGAILLRQFLPRIIPHLIVKRRVAELVLEYLDPIPIRNVWQYRVDDDELARRRRIREQVTAINASGGRIAWGAKRGV